MKSELNKKIIEEIKEKHLTPKPKSFFILRNIFFWFLFVFSVIIGTISFSAALYNFSGNQEILKNIFIENDISFETLNFFPFF